MLSKFLASIALVSLCASCSVEPTRKSMAMMALADANQRGEYLAYAHNVEIVTSSDGLFQAHASVVERCKSDLDISCTILHSDISRSDHPSATLRLRVSPSAVESLTELASESGIVRSSSTTVEDLAEPVRDTEQTIKKLRSHLADLENLRDQSKNDVRALIDVTAEIARVTSRLESTLGQEAQLIQRVELQILNLNFLVDRQASFFAPIEQALNGFSNDLSAGIAQTISGFAYLIPWLIILLPLLMLTRFLWRKLR